MKKILFRHSVIFILGFIFSFSMMTQLGLAEEKKGSEVSISWLEFKKLLKLDSDEVSLTWEEFQQLLAQAGEEYSIPYSVKNGKIILPREQFKRLLDKMRPPKETILKPPADFIITKAEYHGDMNKKNTIVNALFYIEVFEKEQTSYQSISFLPKSVALEEVLWDGQPGLVLEKNGWYTITTAEKGKHLLKVKYYVPSNLEKGPQVLNLHIPKTAITIFHLTIPLQKVDISIPNAKELQAFEKNQKTFISAVLPATNTISVMAHRKYVAAGVPAKDTPAKIYAQTINLLSIEEDALRANCRIKLTVLQNAISHIEARVPDNYAILYIIKKNGQRIRDWRTIKTDKGTFVRIPFDAPVEGSFTFNILVEQLFKSQKALVGFQGFQIKNAIRETGYLGAEKKSTAEAVPSKTEKLDRIDIKDLPYELVSMSGRPLLFGFRYLRHPYNIQMTIAKHKELPSISTVIDMASLITVVLEDGKRLTKVVYTLRNTWKQFLEMELPAGSEIWTIYVNGKRENASKNKSGKVLIPLDRSEMKDNMLKSFTVDLIYYTKGDDLDFLGNQKIYFPTVDVMISKMLWSVYLPRDYRFIHFSGNLEKEEMANTVNLLLGKTRDFSLDKARSYYDLGVKLEKKPQYRYQMNDEEQSIQSSFMNKAIRQQDLAVQIQNEANLEKFIKQEKSKGLGAPGSSSEILKIELPTSGQIYRFNKTVIEGEPIILTAYFVANSTMTLFKITLFLILLIFIYLFRKGILGLFPALYRWLAGQKKLWDFLTSRTGLRVTLFFAAFIFLFVSQPIFVVLTLLFLLAAFRPQWLIPELAPATKPVKDSPKEEGGKENHD
jgi:hypothetical protein